jgi:hypothetical protein
MGLVDLELQFYDVPLRFVLAEPKIGRELLAFGPNVDNVVAEGSVLENAPEDPDGLPVFEVRGIRQGPSDKEYFGAWVARVAKSNNRSSKPLLVLGKRLHQFFVKFQDQSLFPLLEQAVVATIERSRQEASAEDVHGALRAMDQVFKKIPVKSLQGKFLAQLTTEFPGQSIVDDRLLELGFRRRQGQWLSEEEFRSVEGFVWSEQKWIKASEYEFSRVIKALAHVNLTNLILRSRTTREYKELAKAGNITQGMSRAETARAAGFPDRVRRVQIKKDEIDQWDYVDFRIYLVNGQALTVWTPPAGSEGIAAFKGIGDAVREALEDDGKKRPVR